MVHHEWEAAGMGSVVKAPIEVGGRHKFINLVKRLICFLAE